MNTKNISILFQLSLLLILVMQITGCKDYFRNPIEDKETGEDINLLLIDFNFFKTQLSFKFIDATDGSIISEDATVKFTGKNGTDIVSFAGEKKPEFFTSEGQLELAVDPNIAISSGSPMEFSINVEIDGYNSLSKAFMVQSEGVKTYELSLSKIADEEITDLTGEVDYENNDTIFYFFTPSVEVKSATIEEKPYKIGYSISINDLKKLLDLDGNIIFHSSAEIMSAYHSDPANFIVVTISSFSNYQPEIDVVNVGGTNRNVLFHKLETGKCKKLIIGGTIVGNLNGGIINSESKYLNEPVPDIFGFAKFETEHWNMLGTATTYNTVNFSYTLAKASEDFLCEKGSSITFKSSVVSSFSFDADVFDLNGKIITAMNFKGKFPETFVVENVPEMAVKMVFRNNNPSFKDIPPLEISNFCNGNYEISVRPEAQYVGYRIVMKAMCRNNPSVGIAPTYSVDVKLKDSDNPWQTMHMEGGVVDLLGIPDREYSIRLLWENEWEYSTYSTKFDANGNYLGNPQEDAKVKSKKLEDGRIQISIEKIFDQDICDEMGW